LPRGISIQDQMALATIRFFKGSNNQPVPLKTIYTHLVSEQKFRHVISSNKLSKVLTRMNRRNILMRHKDGTVNLSPVMYNLSEREILMALLIRWPKDIYDCLK